MLLAIDAGNTNIVFAAYRDGVRLGSWRISTHPGRTADEYAALLANLFALAGLSLRDVAAAVIASVVPAANPNLLRMCRDLLGLEPMMVGDPGVDLGIRVLLDNPGELGADRVVNAIAARRTYTPPLVIVDFGTATTFDVVDGDGNYCGGAIAPGINLSLEALARAAAKLPKVDVALPDRVIGRNTVAAMQSGIFWGYVGLIEGIVSRIRQEFGQPMTVVATGGLAVLFAQATDMIQQTDGDLTLRGLLEIHERNRPR